MGESKETRGLPNEGKGNLPLPDSAVADSMRPSSSPYMDGVCYAPTTRYVQELCLDAEVPEAGCLRGGREQQRSGGYPGLSPSQDPTSISAECAPSSRPTRAEPEPAIHQQLRPYHFDDSARAALGIDSRQHGQAEVPAPAAVAGSAGMLEPGDDGNGAGTTAAVTPHSQHIARRLSWQEGTPAPSALRRAAGGQAGGGVAGGLAGTTRRRSWHFETPKPWAATSFATPASVEDEIESSGGPVWRPGSAPGRGQWSTMDMLPSLSPVNGTVLFMPGLGACGAIKIRHLAGRGPVVLLTWLLGWPGDRLCLLHPSSVRLQHTRGSCGLNLMPKNAEAELAPGEPFAVGGSANGLCYRWELPASWNALEVAGAPPII